MKYEKINNTPDLKRWIVVLISLFIALGFTGYVSADSGVEVIKERTLNSKTFDNGMGPTHLKLMADFYSISYRLLLHSIISMPPRGVQQLPHQHDIQDVTGSQRVRLMAGNGLFVYVRALLYEHETRKVIFA